MDTPETETTETPTASLADRIRFINEQANGIHAAYVSGSTEPPVATVLSLICCGLVALTEIADAQQRMAAVAEADLTDAINAAVADGVTVKMAEKEKETTKRGFIGQNKNSG
jgi:hypothetical protein